MCSVVCALCVCVLPLAEPKSVTCFGGRFFRVTTESAARMHVGSWAGVFRVRVWARSCLPARLHCCLSAHKQIPSNPLAEDQSRTCPENEPFSHQKAKSVSSQVRVHATLRHILLYVFVVAQSILLYAGFWLCRNEHNEPDDTALSPLPIPILAPDYGVIVLAGPSSAAAQRPCCRVAVLPWGTETLFPTLRLYSCQRQFLNSPGERSLSDHKPRTAGPP